MKFSDNLRNIRITRCMTQMELAEALHTSQSAITSWENGRREPDFKTIERIATYFNVPISALLPSSDDLESEYLNIVAETLHQNPKIEQVFDKLRFMSDRDLDVILVVADAITRNAGGNS